MPPDITIFAAKHLMSFDAVLAAVVTVALLYRKHHAAIVSWIIIAGITVVVSLLLFRIGNALVVDPRPFVAGHFRPLLPHTPNNGFPSGYALLTTVIVFAIALLSRRWAIPFLLLAVLVDWSRVGIGFQHTTDIVGGCACVGLAGLVALTFGPTTSAVLLPSISSRWTLETFRLKQRRVLRV